MNKLKSLSIIFFLAIAGISNAQSAKDVFTSNTLTWYGLDFSHARFIGDFGTIVGRNGNVLRDGFFAPWNYVLVKEREKYDFAKYYSKDSYEISNSEVDEINSKVDGSTIIVNEQPPALTESVLQAEVNKFKKGKSGIGLVYIVEAFNKTTENGIINTVFFERETGKILLIKRLQAKPKGFGVKNYWLRTVLETMQTSKDEWKSWKKEAGLKK